MQYVQKHERDWGNKSYPGRPTLEDVMNARVVTFWQPLNKHGSPDEPGREIIVIYEDLKAVESYLTRLIFLANKFRPDRQFLRAYVDQKQVKVKKARIQFGYVEDDD